MAKINQQIASAGAAGVLKEALERKNHLPKVVTAASETVLQLLESPNLTAENKRALLDELASGDLPSTLLDLQDSLEDPVATKNCQQILFKLVQHDNTCIKPSEQAMLVDKVVSSIKDDNYKEGFAILNDLMAADPSVLAHVNIQDVVVASIAQNKEITQE